MSDRAFAAMTDTMPRITGGLCADQDPEIWQSDDPDTMRYAVDECRACPALAVCREWALSHDEAGTWGGLTEGQRWSIKHKGKRAHRRVDTPEESPVRALDSEGQKNSGPGGAGNAVIPGLTLPRKG